MASSSKGSKAVPPAGPLPHKQLPGYGWHSHHHPLGPARVVSETVQTTKHDFGGGTKIVTTKTRVLDQLSEEERRRLETAGMLAVLGPPDPQSGSILSRLAGRPLEALMSMMDVQTLGRFACTCRLYARARWPVIDIKKRSRDRLGWETAIPYIVSRQPSLLRLPGNPDRQHPMKREALAALSGCSALQFVSLRYVRCGNDGSQVVGEALRTTWHHVVWLDLSRNGIDAGGAEALAAGLPAAAGLQYLSLAINVLKDKGAAAVARALPGCVSLKVLLLSENEIGSAGAKALGAALAEGAAATVLETLDLSRNPLTAEGAANLASGLARNKGLRTLSLAACKISGTGGAGLGRALAQHPTMDFLDLSENDLRGTGAQGLVEGLASNRTLKALNLARASLGTVGARSLDLLHKSAVVKLDVSENGLDDAAVRDLVASLRDAPLQALLLAGGGGDLAHAGGGEMRDTGAAALSDWLVARGPSLGPQLEYLALPSQGLRDAGIASLLDALASSCPRLGRLDLAGNKFTVEGCRALGAFLAGPTGCTLHILDLHNNSIKDAGLAALLRGLASPGGAVPALHTLNMLNCGFTNSGADSVTALLERLSRIRRLHIGGADSISDASWTRLKRASPMVSFTAT